MTDEDRLQNVVSRLKAQDTFLTGGERKVTLSDEPSGLQAILVEISETVLARELRFAANSGRVLSLLVSARRVHQVVAAPNKNLVGQDLSEEEQTQAGDLKALFAAVLGNAQTLSISATRPDQSVDPTSVGWSADTLASLWGVELFPEPIDPPTLAEFLDHFRAIRLAELRFEGGRQAGSDGDEDQIEVLENIAKPLLGIADVTGRVFGDESDRTITVLGTGPAGAVSGVVVQAGGQGAALLLPSDQIDAALAFWNAA